jgi:hypothetical protein
MADLSQQVQLQQALNDALRDRASLMSEQNDLMSQQSDTANQLRQSLGSPEATQRVRNMTDALRQSNEEMEEGADRTRELSDALEEAGDNAEDAGSQFNMFGAAFSAVKSAFSGALSLFGSVASGVAGIAASIGKAAFAIFSFPFKLFSGLIELAQSGGGGNPIREAYEEVREVFGDLASGPGKAVVNTFKKVRSETGGLAKTGLSFRKVFGYGPGGVAAMIKGMNELAQGLGDNFYKLQGQFEQMGSKAIVFSKGLGLSNEEFGELAGLASAKGRKVEEYFTEISTLAVKANKTFGIGIKDMSKGMKELAHDVDNFGHLGPKAFQPIVVFARKLGLEIKDMAGIMDKFAGFEDTTEAASKMSQAFGINVDSMQLMAAQNPAEKIDILRKAFFKSGKDLSKFSYQQRKYLTSLTGLEGKSLDAAFALDKQGISYDKIAKKTDKANKKQISQQKVLKELAKGIKRLVPSGGGQKVKGFFDAFVKGFERGIMRSRTFRKMLRNIRKGLRLMERFGRRIGRMFVKMFPGIKDMMEGITDFFRPAKFKVFIKAVEKGFKEFFESGSGNVTDLFDIIRQKLSDFGSDTSALDKLLGGFKKFATFAMKMVASAIRYVLNILSEEVAPFISGFLQDANKALESGDAGSHLEALFMTLEKKIGGSKLGKAFLEIINPLTDLFSGADNPFQKVFKAFEKAYEDNKKFLTGLGEEIGSAFMDGMLGWFAYAGLGLLGAAVLKMMGTGVLTAIGTFFTKIPGFIMAAARALGGMVTALGGFATILRALLTGPLMGFHIAISAISGLFDAFDPKKGHESIGGRFATFVGGFAESLTFGIVESDAFLDAVTGTNYVVERKIGEMNDKYAYAAEEFSKTNLKYLNKAKEELGKLRKEFEGGVDAIGDIFVGLEGKLDKGEQDTLRTAKKVFENITKITDSEEAKITAAFKRRKAQAKGIENLLKEGYDELDDTDIDKIEGSLEGAGQKFKRDLYFKIQKEAQKMGIKDAITMEGDLVTISEEFMEKRGAFAMQLLKGMKKSEGEVRKEIEGQTKDAVKKQMDQLKTLDRAQLLSIRKKAKESNMKTTVIDKALKAVLEAEIKKKYAGQEFSKAKIEAEVRKKMKQIDESDAKTKAKKKLKQLESEEALLSQIEAFADVPKRLKKAMKAFNTFDPAEMKQGIKVLLKQVSTLAESIGKELSTMSVTPISKKSQELIKTFDSNNDILNDFMGDFAKIIENFRKLKKLVRNPLFTKKFTAKTFTGQIKKIAYDMVKLPAAVMEGLAPLVPINAVAGFLMKKMGADPKILEDGARAQGMMDAMTRFSKEGGAKTTIDAIVDFIDPISEDLAKIKSAALLIKKTSKGFPTISDKDSAAMAEGARAVVRAVGNMMDKFNFGHDLFVNNRASEIGNAAKNLGAVPTLLKKVRGVSKAAKKSIDGMSAIDTVGGGLMKLHTGLYNFVEKPVVPGDIQGLEQVMVALGVAIDNVDPTAGMKLGGAVDSIFGAITTATGAGGNTKSLAEAKVIVDALANFTGGNIVVTSDLPDKFTINIGVKIDSEKLGQAIVATNLTKGGEADYIQTDKTKSVLGA